ncbi:MAG: lytic transglycosylase domain-containing protein [Acidobacteriaceae bacterium]
MLATLLCPFARAFQRVTLRSGFSYDCARYQIVDANHIRLFLSPHSDNFIVLSRSLIARIETLPDPPQPDPVPNPSDSTAKTQSSTVAAHTPANIPLLLSVAARQHRIDAQLLASIVDTESAGRPDAVSPAGAQGLMQLMPGTAQQLGVRDAFRPDQNITGGATYLDQLLNRYDPHNDQYGLAEALAAYNAGPAAVDRYHGIPPYPETIRYVNRVLKEFNRRVRALQRLKSPSLPASLDHGPAHDGSAGLSAASPAAPTPAVTMTAAETGATASTDASQAISLNSTPTIALSGAQ